MTLFLLAIVLSVIIQSSITTIPITLMLLIFAAIIFQKKEMYLLAIISGLFLDILTFRTIGISSLFFVICIFFIFTYKRKFEIKSIYFISIFSFISSFVYLLITSSGNVLLQSIFATLINMISFTSFYAFIDKKAKYR